MQFELEFLKALQSVANPVLDFLFELITMLAEDKLLIAVITFIFWNVNKNAGKKIVYSLFVSICINGGIKDIFRRQRPHQVAPDEIIGKRAETATGYSFPSGHSQNISSTLCAFALWIKKRWFYVLTVVMCLLVGLSRLYLGVHFPTDVVVGLMLGATISAICAFIHDKVKNHSILYLVTFCIMALFLFNENSEDFLKSLGLFGGLVVANPIEEKFIRFDEKDHTKLEGIVRWILGIGVILGVMALGKVIFGEETDFSHFIVYFFVSFFAIGVFPFAFPLIKKIFKKA